MASQPAASLDPLPVARRAADPDGCARRHTRRRRAPPASPAAGWIQMSSNIPLSRIFPLATQFSATPPAIVRRRLPLRSRAVRASRRTISSVTCCTASARSMCACVSSDSGSRRGIPNSRSHRRLVHHPQARWRSRSTACSAASSRPCRMSTSSRVIRATKSFVRAESAWPYGASPISLYSPLFTVNPR